MLTMSEKIVIYASAALLLIVIGYYGGQYDLHNGPDRLIDPDTYMIQIGPTDNPECFTEVTLTVWDEMNRMGVWAWPAACVAAQEERLMVSPDE